MSGKNYLVSGKGFYGGKQLVYDLECVGSTIPIKNEIVWVDNVREAKNLSGKSARNLIKIHNLDAFIWQPYKEEPIINQWKVIQRSNNYGFLNEKNHCALEWKAVKVVHENKTDVKFLANPNQKNEYYSEEDAKALAKEKNLAIIVELQKKMEDQ